MSSRIHDCLDGELPPKALSADDAGRLLEMQQTIASVARHLHSAPVPELSGRVMMQLSRQSTPSASTLLGLRARAWLRHVWVPRRISFEVRPVHALGAAMAGLVLMVAPLSTPDAPLDAPAAVPHHHAPTAYVQFRLDAPGASQVALAGSFTDWKPRYVMQEREPGVWTAMVPVEAGAHEYLFVVDGQEWVPDPAADTVSDDFGGANSRLLVAPPRAHT